MRSPNSATPSSAPSRRSPSSSGEKTSFSGGGGSRRGGSSSTARRSSGLRSSSGGGREMYQVLEDAFVDHWGHTERTYEEWLATHTIEHELSFLVRTGDEVAAGALCKRELFGMGWVDVLGTRREYRRRGLGDALI